MLPTTLLTNYTVDQQIAPTDDEVKAFENYDGEFDDLAPPEQFLSVLSNIKRLHRKVDALIVMNQFDVRCRHIALTCAFPAHPQSQALLESITDCIRVIEKACGQVRNSKRLALTMQAVVLIGNEMNAGTARGNAAGVRIDCLPKLADIKVREVTMAWSACCALALCVHAGVAAPCIDHMC